MDLRVDPDRPLSPSRQIVETVLDAIAAGELVSGARLPSVREAAGKALVNPNTVARAWRELEEMGVVDGRAGTGVFVTSAGPEIARRERRKATLAALRSAVEEALRSGHSCEDVLAEVERALRRARGEGSRAGIEKGGGR